MNIVKWKKRARTWVRFHLASMRDVEEVARKGRHKGFRVTIQLAGGEILTELGPETGVV